jgi:NifU-like protein involved in Fe-S cluster formation
MHRDAVSRMYSELVRDHFSRPRCIGEIDHPDAAGEAKNEADGDRVVLTLRIRDGVIEQARVKVMGCVAAIASASYFTEWMQGRTVAEAAGLTKEALAERMGGLPENKIRCSLTCVNALHDALSRGRDGRG